MGSENSVPGTTSRRHYDLSRQMSLLRAATTTRIDEELSPGNITAIRGETALLVCTIVNIGDKSVGNYDISKKILIGEVKEEFITLEF